MRNLRAQSLRRLVWRVQSKPLRILAKKLGSIKRLEYVATIGTRLVWDLSKKKNKKNRRVEEFINSNWRPYARLGYKKKHHMEGWGITNTRISWLNFHMRTRPGDSGSRLEAIQYVGTPLASHKSTHEAWLIWGNQNQLNHVESRFDPEASSSH